jgi:hypothetical protein
VPWACLPAASLIGLGAGLFDATTTPSIVQLSTPDVRRKALSHKYWFNNIGLGVGALAGAALLSDPTAGRFTVAYTLKAASCALLAGIVFGCLTVDATAGTSPNVDGSAVHVRRKGRDGLWSVIQGSRAVRMVLLTELLLVLCGLQPVRVRRTCGPHFALGGASEFREHPVGRQHLCGDSAPAAGNALGRSPLRTTDADVVWLDLEQCGGSRPIRWQCSPSGAICRDHRLRGAVRLGRVLLRSKLPAAAGAPKPGLRLPSCSAAASTVWGTAAVAGPPLGVWLAASTAASGVWLLLLVGAATAVFLCRVIDREIREHPPADHVGGGAITEADMVS